MTLVLESHSTSQRAGGGGRPSSSAYRESLELSDGVAGLQSDVNRYELLLLVKKVGPSAGFSPRAIQLLDYYLAYTTEQDWTAGSRVIVYQSVAKTALDLGVTERQIQNLERQLFDLGALTWRDSGNHRRFGQRDKKTGKLLYGFGIDLTPLASLREKLENLLRDKQFHNQAWLETKRQISWHRRQVRGLLLELASGEGASLAEYEARYQALSWKIRTHHPLTTLRTLLGSHQTLRDELLEVVRQRAGTAPISSGDAKTFAPTQSTTQPSLDKSKVTSPAGVGFQEDAAGSSAPNFKRGGDVEASEGGGEAGDPVLATGLQHVSLKDVLGVARSQVWESMPSGLTPASWNEVVEAAYRLRSELCISQQSWGEACRLLGRAGAAVCVLLTDRATTRELDPVREPAAYFRGMLRKFPTGELRLHRSILGLLAPAGLRPLSGHLGETASGQLTSFGGSLC